MGRPSATAKRRKRFNQKVKRKLDKNASADYHGAETTGPCPHVNVNILQMEDTHIQEQGDVCYTTNTNSKELSYSHQDDEPSDNCLGEDIDVVLMGTEDSLLQLECDKKKSKHSYEYLLECREKLIQKVKLYRRRIEEQSSEIAEMTYKHKKELKHIRSFYQGIAYAPTRTWRIVKTAHCSTSKAAEIMRELGLKYKDAFNN